MKYAKRISSREIWTKAGMILDQHGDGSADYIIDQLDAAFGDMGAIEDWRRIAAAVDYIAGTKFGS